MNKNICLSCGKKAKNINNQHNDIENTLCDFCRDFVDSIIIEGQN